MTGLALISTSARADTPELVAARHAMITEAIAGRYAELVARMLPQAVDPAGPNADAVKALEGFFDIVREEDRLAIEAVQRARSSPVWRQHFYAPFWDALHHRFNQLVMEDMERVPARASIPR